MTVSSLYALPDFLDDRGEVVVQQVKQTSKMKLLTVAQDYRLHDRLKRFGLRDSQSLNMYDWLQGALDYEDHGLANDMRVLPRYDKRAMILAPANDENLSFLSLQSQGEHVGKLNYLPDRVAQTGIVELFDGQEHKWAQDFYDCRGFLSRRQYFNPDGKLGLELIYHVDGTPVMEISHMGENTMYRLLGTHGLPNWILRNELSVMLWWYGRILTENETVYNSDALLDPVWLQLTDRLKLIQVAYIQNSDPQRVKVLKQQQEDGVKIVAVNEHVARTFGYDYKPAFVSGQPVKQVKIFSPLRVLNFGIWANDQVVKQLVMQIKEITKLMPHVIVHLIGYFSIDSQKTYEKLIQEYNLSNRVVMHGNLTGERRKQVIQSCALAWWLPLGDESLVKPALLNYYGLPVISTVKGFRGAVIKDPTPELIAQAVQLGLNNLSKWREDVRQATDLVTV